MSVIKVKEFFNEKKFNIDIIELKNSATVALAAESLGVKENEIAKTLALQLKDGSNIVIVFNGCARIDNTKFKNTFGVKPKMIQFNEIERKIGHPAGGVCPFGINKGIKIYLDESLKEFEYVYPASGSTNTVLKISVKDLENITEGIWIDVSKC